jgi:hypothetical protein
MLFWGHFEILCAYAVLPFVLLFTDLLLQRKAGLYLFLLAGCLSFVLLSQIEFAFIFLLLYAPYIVFTLYTKRVGWQQLLSIVSTNRVWVIMTLLVLSIPLYFYISVITQYGYFAGLQPHDIEGGLSHYTLQHFGDVFMAKADDLSDSWVRPSTDYYASPIAFVVLLAATVLVHMDKDKKRAAAILFFLVMGMAFLILSAGVNGPLFPLLRQIVPALQGMRVPVRFYYCFAVCLPVIFSLSCVSLSEMWPGTSRTSARAGSVIRSLVPLLLVLGLVLDFAHYFDLYHLRLVNRQEFDRQLVFLEENIPRDPPSNGVITRIEFYPPYATPAEYWTHSDLELAGTALPWNQYDEAVTFYHITSLGLSQDRMHLEFFSNMLSIDFIMLQNYTIAPAADASLPEYHEQKLASLDALSGTTDGPLLFKGSLDTDYYTIYLYQVKEASDKVRFHALDSSLVVLSDELFVSYDLFHGYSQVSHATSADAFLDTVVAVSSDLEDASGSPVKAVAVEDIPLLMTGEPETDDRPLQVENFKVTAKGLSLDVNAPDNGVLSLAYYYNPWWKVYVDGQLSESLRVNGILAGTYLSQGQHSVEFVYDYPSLPNVVTRLWR